jgi:hypothetical protein
MSVISLPPHNRQDTTQLAHDLIALVCGDFKKMAFEPLYRACYFMVLRGEHETLQSLLKFAIRSMLTCSNHTDEQTKLRLNMLSDVTMFFQKTTIPKSKRFLPLKLLFREEKRLAEQRARSVLKRYTNRHFLETYLRPGGLYERKAAPLWLQNVGKKRTRTQPPAPVSLKSCKCVAETVNGLAGDGGSHLNSLFGGSDGGAVADHCSVV